MRNETKIVKSQSFQQYPPVLSFSDRPHAPPPFRAQSRPGQNTDFPPPLMENFDKKQKHLCQYAPRKSSNLSVEKKIKSQNIYSKKAYVFNLEMLIWCFVRVVLEPFAHILL